MLRQWARLKEALATAGESMWRNEIEKLELHTEALSHEQIRSIMG